MAGLLIHYMAPIMFVALVVFLLLGYPVAFSLGAVGLIFGFIGIEVGLFRPDFLQALPERIYGIMNNDVLLAIPFFTFMGLILERSGMAEDLLDTIGQLFGTIRGGLAYAVIFVGALLAATTGVVAASVISMGLISLPIMLRYGYDRRVASGVIAASGTLAQIIPPSLVLIVMADQLGRSVGDMYEGAFLPGLVLAGDVCRLHLPGQRFCIPKAAPGLPVEDIGYREPDGARGVWQLGVLVLFSGIVAYLPDAQTNVRAGADFVVLTHVARRGRVVPLLGVQPRVRRALVLRDRAAVRRCSLAAWYWLDTHNHENWAILLAALVGRRVLCAGRRADRACDRLPPHLGHGRADHLRDGAAAGADLPRARHDLHRRRDADRRRRDGRGRRADPRHDEAPADLRSDAAGGRVDRQALGLRGVHPGRRARLLAHLLRRRRPPLGRGDAGLACRAGSSASSSSSTCSSSCSPSSSTSSRSPSSSSRCSARRRRSSAST